MTRILISELPKKAGEKVTVKGWLHKKRLLGGLNFLTVRDRTGLVQSLIEDKAEIEKLRGMQIGTVVTFVGTVKEDERAPGGVELHDVEVTVDVPVTEEPPIEIDKPISHKSEHLENLFDNRVLNMRNLTEQKIFKIRASIVQELRRYLIEQDFIEVDTPKLLAEATEGGAEVFELDYFGKKATLAQSPQFCKQMLVGAFERVFEIGHSYRAEPSATTRHLTELTMLDIEMGFVEGHDEVKNLVASTIRSAVEKAYDKHAADLKFLNAPELFLTADGSVPGFTVAEIHELYSKANKVDTTGEKDLIPDEERWIAKYAREKFGSDFVYATNFPAEAGKFYHKFLDDGTVAWADLLFRGLEIATVPLRENNYEKMIEQMKNAGLNVEAPGFRSYLNAFKYGLPAHEGAGVNVDRIVQKTIGLKNVKESTLFPRDINRLDP